MTPWAMSFGSCGGRSGVAGSRCLIGLNTLLRNRALLPVINKDDEKSWWLSFESPPPPQAQHDDLNAAIWFANGKRTHE